MNTKTTHACTKNNPAQELVDELHNCGGWLSGGGLLGLDNKGRLCVNRESELKRVSELTLLEKTEGKSINRRTVSGADSSENESQQIKDRIRYIIREVTKHHSVDIQKAAMLYIERYLKVEKLGYSHYAPIDETVQLLARKDAVEGLPMLAYERFSKIIILSEDEFNQELHQFSEKAILSALLNPCSNLRTDIARHLAALYMEKKETELLGKLEAIERSSPEALVDALEKRAFSTFHPYLVECVKAKAGAWKQLCGFKHCGKLKYEDMHRFIVNRLLEDNGTFVNESDMFSTAGLFNALSLAHTMDVKNMNSDQYLELAKTAFGRHGESLGKGGESNSVHNYRGRYTFFYIKGKLSELPYDSDGLSDLRERSKNHFSLFNLIEDKEQNTIKLEHKCEQGTFLHDSPQDEFRSKFMADEIFVQLRHQVKLANNSGGRLMAYINAARELELHGLFHYGNSQLSIIVLMALIAQDGELPMMFFENMNGIVGMGPWALLEKVLEGMERYAKHTGIPEESLNIEQLKYNAGLRGVDRWGSYYETEYREVK